MAPKTWTPVAKLLPSTVHVPSAKDLVTTRDLGGSLLAYCLEYDPAPNTPDFLMYLGMHLTLQIPKLHRLDLKKACTNPDLAQEIAGHIDKIMERILVRLYYPFSTSWVVDSDAFQLQGGLTRRSYYACGL